MKKNFIFLFLILCLTFPSVFAQENTAVRHIIKEATENSQLEILAHELLDGIGPRLVGTPQMEQAHQWAVKKFNGWGIAAENQQWGQWRGWQRGYTHIDMTSPWVRSLSGRILAWSPGTQGKTVSGEAVVLPPNIADTNAFKKWLPTVKGKFVLVSMLQPTGRPDDNWEKWATKESFAKMKKAREADEKAWQQNLRNTGYNARTLPAALEKAGAAGILSSYWSKGFGADKVFGAYTAKIPSVDINLEDYGLLYRLALHGNKPVVSLAATSKDLGSMPTFNTIARIEGVEKPDEYVFLSAHFDSWDGAQGATDNGTGTILMMETARILKKVYPNPKRTILIGLWGSEEQGLNGSRAFVHDHPEIVKNIQAVFNQDNGTGRVVNISGSGFVHAYDYLSRWLAAVPDSITHQIETSFPGFPASGGTDHASFVAAGAPAFNLTALSWDYWNYTWHTNLDTYDKIVFDDVKNNVILTAILAYMASEDPQTASRERRRMPVDPGTGIPNAWPPERDGNRNGGMD